MLAPPPEGTFYVEEANLPIRDFPKGGAQTPKDDSLEQALLLTHDDVQSNSNPQKNGKVTASCSADELISSFAKIHTP